MSDDYQLRRDIDRIINLINNNQFNNWDELINSLEEPNLFRDDLKELDGSLTNLSESLDELSLELYGDTTHDGLTDYIDQLQVLIYGKGGTYVKDGVTYNCSIDEPCPDSMKGVLNLLRSETTDLKYSLNALTIGLTSFTMTLEQFKAELTRQEISYDELDTGITTLLELIFNAQRRIDSTNSVIGTDSDTSSDGTVFGFLNDTTDTANLASNKATEVRKVLYSGSSDTGTSGNPATGTVKANLNTAQSNIVTVQGDIVNIQTDVDTLLLKNNSWQILHIGAVDNVSINTILTNYPLFNINNVNYALNDNQGYVRDGSSWIKHSITDILDKIDIAFVTCLNMNSDTETILSTYDLEFTWVYDISQDCFYKYQNNQWIVESNLDVYGKMFRNQIGVNIIDMIYPIGSIYMSVNNVSPDLFIGGTWVQLTDTFLYATSGTADTGTTAPSGQGEATHTLTIDEMPSHNHGLRMDWGDTDGNVPYTRSGTPYRLSVDQDKYNTSSKGGGQAHNNMPPYMKVYMWKRTG